MQADGNGYARTVLLVNGIADIGIAVLMILLIPLGLPLPGYHQLGPVELYLGGGWGVATLALGLGRVMASGRPEYHRLTVLVGFFEGSALTLYTLTNLLVARVTLTQALLPLCVGVFFAVAYARAFRDYRNRPQYISRI